MLTSFLQQLPELAVFSFKHAGISNAPLQRSGLAQLSCLQQLQRCSLCCPRVTAAELVNLTSSNLTSLTLTKGRGWLQEASLPAAGWPHLRELSVSHQAMQPAVLSRLTALEQLSLTSCRLLADINKVSGSLWTCTSVLGPIYLNIARICPIRIRSNHMQ